MNADKRKSMFVQSLPMFDDQNILEDRKRASYIDHGRDMDRNSAYDRSFQQSRRNSMMSFQERNKSDRSFDKSFDRSFNERIDRSFNERSFDKSFDRSFNGFDRSFQDKNRSFRSVNGSFNETSHISEDHFGAPRFTKRQEKYRFNKPQPKRKDATIEARIFALFDTISHSHMTSFQQTALAESLQCTYEFVRGLEAQYGSIPTHLEGSIEKVLDSYSQFVKKPASEPKRLSILGPVDDSGSEFDDESDTETPQAPMQHVYTPVSAFTPEDETPFLPQMLDRQMDPVFSKRSSMPPFFQKNGPKSPEKSSKVKGDWTLPWNKENRNSPTIPSPDHFTKQHNFERPWDSAAWARPQSAYEQAHRPVSSIGLQNPLHAHANWEKRKRHSYMPDRR